MRIVVITGSRDWKDYDPIGAALEGAELVIHGGAPGADSIANHIAKSQELDTFVLRARWRQRGKAAGPERNDRMARLAAQLQEDGFQVQCFAFPLSGSRGTWNCIECMRARGIETTVYGEGKR